MATAAPSTTTANCGAMGTYLPWPTTSSRHAYGQQYLANECRGDAGASAATTPTSADAAARRGWSAIMEGTSSDSGVMGHWGFPRGRK